MAALSRAISAADAHRGRLNEVLPGLQAAHPGLVLDVTGEDQPLPLAAGGLTVILQQLLSNAAAAGATRVSIAAEPARLTITDNGKGISPGNRAHVFDPFFTTRRDTGGTGMGLTITANLLAAHGAEIRLLSPDQGAGFEISFDPDRG